MPLGLVWGLIRWINPSRDLEMFGCWEGVGVSGVLLGHLGQQPPLCLSICF